MTGPDPIEVAPPAGSAARHDPVVAVEPEPAAAEAVFGDRIEVVRRFAADLADRGVLLGLIGPREPARVWSRHVLNCGLLARLLPAGRRVADVGSGAGLPGLVLAAARPDLKIALIEPMQRRTDWLADEQDRLGLTNVEVVRARAEDVAERYDVVTARAVGPLRTLLPQTARLAVAGGELVLMKGANVDDELAAAGSAVRRLRLQDVRIDLLGEDLRDAGMAIDPTRVLRATVPPGS